MYKLVSQLTLIRHLKWFPDLSAGKLRTDFRCLVLFLVLAACSAPPELIGIENPKVPRGAVVGGTAQKVFIATTRQRSDKPGALYSGERSRVLNFASVDVLIPPTHVVGQIERPKRLPPDPRKEFAVVDPVLHSSGPNFAGVVNEALSAFPAGKRNILVFVHGYNTTTSDTVLRVAQFIEDSGYEGVPIIFDWASAGQTTKYLYDMNSALVARENIPALIEVLSRTKAENVDIFAHSMGTLLAMEGLLDYKQKGLPGEPEKLGGIILASPDIDLDLFRSQLRQQGDSFDIFVLLSQDDRALSFSRFIAGGVPRVGAAATEELTGLGVVVLDLTEVESGGLQHSKFADSPEVVQLIGQGLNQVSNFDYAEGSDILGILLKATPIDVAF